VCDNYPPLCYIRIRSEPAPEPARGASGEHAATMAKLRRSAAAERAFNLQSRLNDTLAPIVRECIELSAEGWDPETVLREHAGHAAGSGGRFSDVIF
jgi:hypothetical protein